MMGACPATSNARARGVGPCPDPLPPSANACCSCGVTSGLSNCCAGEKRPLHAAFPAAAPPPLTRPCNATAWSTVPADHVGSNTRRHDARSALPRPVGSAGGEGDAAAPPSSASSGATPRVTLVPPGAGPGPCPVPVTATPVSPPLANCRVLGLTATPVPGDAGTPIVSRRDGVTAQPHPAGRRAARDVACMYAASLSRRARATAMEITASRRTRCEASCHRMRFTRDCRPALRACKSSISARIMRASVARDVTSRTTIWLARKPARGLAARRRPRRRRRRRMRVPEGPWDHTVSLLSLPPPGESESLGGAPCDESVSEESHCAMARRLPTAYRCRPPRRPRYTASSCSRGVLSDQPMAPLAPPVEPSESVESKSPPAALPRLAAVRFFRDRTYSRARTSFRARARAESAGSSASSAANFDVVSECCRMFCACALSAVTAGVGMLWPPPPAGGGPMCRLEKPPLRENLKPSACASRCLAFASSTSASSASASAASFSASSSSNTSPSRRSRASYPATRLASASRGRASGTMSMPCATKGTWGPAAAAAVAALLCATRPASRRLASRSASLRPCTSAPTCTRRTPSAPAVRDPTMPSAAAARPGLPAAFPSVSPPCHTSETTAVPPPVRTIHCPSSLSSPGPGVLTEEMLPEEPELQSSGRRPPFSATTATFTRCRCRRLSCLAATKRARLRSLRASFAAAAASWSTSRCSSTCSQ